MGEELVFGRINNLLEESGCKSKINSMSELKAFLNNKSNEGISVYDEIEELYYALVVGPGMW
ncbi:MAG TPA: hypothetical protein VHT34_05455 [Clostridia bacterium]|nr:hypothetical protein [Clostridia bacterium]